MEETSTVDDTAAALAIQPHPLADKRSLVLYSENSERT
jgi:hypothetical protein